MLRVRTAGCAIPGVLLVVLPKCPACLAAWIAVATGASVPVAAAARLHTVVVILCVLSIAAVAARFGLRRRAGSCPFRDSEFASKLVAPQSRLNVLIPA